MRVNSVQNSVGSFKISNYNNQNKQLSSNNRDFTQPSCLPSTVNFLGTYFAATDCHARVPMMASTLSEIENRIEKDKTDEPLFFIDGGDFFGESYQIESIGKIYSTFQKRNPDVTTVFNLGNYDISALLGWGVLARYEEPMVELFEKMSDSGINFVSATYCLAADERENMGFKIHRFDNIKPYMILNDTVNGRPQKVFVTGIGVSELERNGKGIENKKRALEYALNTAKKDGVYPNEFEKTIILIHESPKNCKELIKYAKEALGLDNVRLVIGGHPHSIDDFNIGKTRALYPPAQGKGAYIIKSTEEGFDFSPLKLKSSGYDYSPLAENVDVIDNSDINNAFPLKHAYQEILKSPENGEFSRIITESSPYSLEFRNYGAKLSSPTTFGTYIANKYREIFGGDFALSRNQLIREKLPCKGQAVTAYNICDSINVDSGICRIKISTDKLKEIFEIALKKQNTGITNSPFLEYSDNLRVTRKGNAKEDEDKVVQIEIFEDGGWKKLLDEDGNALYPDRIFDVVTEDVLATGILHEFQGLGINSKNIEGATMRNLLEYALKNEIPNPNEPDYHTSKMFTV